MCFHWPYLEYLSENTSGNLQSKKGVSGLTTYQLWSKSNRNYTHTLYTTLHYTVANKTTGLFYNIFSLLTWDLALTQSMKVPLYKLLIRYFPTHAAPACSSTCSSNHLRLQVIHSKCLRVIGNRTTSTPTYHLHNFLNIQPIPVLIHRLTDNFFAHCPHTPTPKSKKYGIKL